MPTAAYIGPPAHLVPLEYMTSMRVKQGGRYAMQTAASRQWAFVTNTADTLPSRSWELALTASSSSMAVLQGMASGAYGDGPFVWAPESAYITNVLTPAQSSLLGATGPGSGTTDGWAPRTALGPNQITLAAGVPVLPGAPMTATVDASGPAIIRAVFRTAGGAEVSVITANSVGSLMQRLSVSTLAVPVTARTVDITVSGHVTAAQPQVVWLPKPAPWAPGAGATSVVITDFEASPLLFDRGRDLFQTATATLQEVD